LFAPHHNFGNPDSFRRFVDTAHAKGLAVILDVVYNHLGPEGNYWSDFGPYLSSRHITPWGAAPNFDDPVHGRPLRQLIIANALHWFDEYHIDALRVDAIHCMRDESDPHIASELAETVHRWSGETGRPAMMIAETNVYDPQMVAGIASGGMGFDAQWCDDFLHSVFAVLRPDEQLCVRSYRAGSDLDRTLQTGFVYTGSIPRAAARDDADSGVRRRQLLADRVDTHGMIYSIQNHDFIGNHPLGKRLHQVSSPEAQRAAAALLLLAPPIPMLFMGEEFLCDQPFQFFVDFGDSHLREATVEGRMREYPQHDWARGRLPTDPDAFHLSKIGSADRGDRATRDWYQALIRLRKRWRSGGLLRDENLAVDNDPGRGLYRLQYTHAGQTVTVAVRLSAESTARDEIECDIPGRLLLDSNPGQTDDHGLLANHAKVFLHRP
jgi:malto-oligosyltrehalose trehalohydrolase